MLQALPTYSQIMQRKAKLLQQCDLTQIEDNELLSLFHVLQKKVHNIDHTTNRVDAVYYLGCLQVFLDRQVVDVDKCNVNALQALIKDKKLSYVQLVQIFLNRIYLYNDFGPKINAIRGINKRALAEAEACDRAVVANLALAKGVFGMPILLKDNIDTCSDIGLPTTAGSIAFAHNYAAEDAVVVKRLRAQGAIILAKTNLSEFANFITNGVLRANGAVEPMPSGYSTLGGQVRCPYKPGVINPAGSSSGSGAGCAAAMGAMAVGTETSGSILNPSTANSLVGIKPTVGLISRRGIIPLSHSQDTAGPMTRCVTDAAILLEAMKCYDGLDMPVQAGSKNVLVTQEYWEEHTSCYTAALNRGALKGMRLGVFTLPDAQKAPDMYLAWEKIAAVLQRLGAELIFSETGATLDYIMQGERQELPWVSELLHLDFAHDLQQYLDGLKNHRITMDDTEIHNLQDIIDYNKCYPERLIYGQSILEKCAGYDIGVNSQDMQRAQQVQLEEVLWSRTETLDKLFELYKLDALISLNGGTTRIAAKAGYPSITVPAGYRDYEHDQYPINLQFTGQAFSEAQLIGMAYDFEQATKARRAPEMGDKKRLAEAIAEAQAAGYQGEELEKAEKLYVDNFSTQLAINVAEQALWEHLF